MRFNANRLAVLAGIGSGSRSLNEAGNRSHHEDRNSDDADLVWGKNQLNEQEADDEEELPGEEDGDKEDATTSEGVTDLDEVIEIDETMLRREIMRMKSERNDTLAEVKLRKAIRSEISDIVSEISLNSDSLWMYGENKPKNSKKGQVTLSALGIGFK